MAHIKKRELVDGTPRWDAEWRDATGRKHKRTFRRRKDASAFLVEVEKEVNDGTWREVRSVPMSEVFGAWRKHVDTEVKLGQLRASTAATYKCNLRCHIESALKDYPSMQLTARVMDEWRAGLADKVADGRMSGKSFNNVFVLMGTILRWARNPARGYMRHDPLEHQSRLKLRDQEAAYLEEPEIAALLAAAADDAEANALVHLMMFAGLRRGEAFALKWDDIRAGDIGGQIRVRRSVYLGEITETKSKDSERDVDVPPAVLEALVRHREGTPPMEPGFIFRSRAGNPRDPNSWYSRAFAKLRQRARLSDRVTLHTMRHTFASLLLNQGEGLKYTSEQLGHSSVQITGDRYGHVLKSQREKAVARMQETIKAAQHERFKVVEGGA